MKLEKEKQRLDEIENQISQNKKEIVNEILFYKYSYDVEKVKSLQDKIEKLQKEYARIRKNPQKEAIEKQIKNINKRITDADKLLENYTKDGVYLITEDMEQLMQDKADFQKEKSDKEVELKKLEKIQQIKKEIELKTEQNKEIKTLQIYNKNNNFIMNNPINKCNKNIQKILIKIKKVKEYYSMLIRKALKN